MADQVGEIPKKELSEVNPRLFRAIEIGFNISGPTCLALAVVHLLLGNYALAAGAATPGFYWIARKAAGKRI